MCENTAKRDDAYLDKLIAKEFPGVFIGLMNRYRQRLRQEYGIDLPRYDEHGKKLNRGENNDQGRNFRIFLVELFKKYGSQTIAFYESKIEKKFPDHHYSVAGLMGRYNAGRFTRGIKPKPQLRIIGEDGIARTLFKATHQTIKEIGSNPSSKTRKKMSEAAKRRHKNNPKWSRRTVRAMHKARKGMKASPETRKKLSEAAKKRLNILP